jgi:hypothetical protein
MPRSVLTFESFVTRLEPALKKRLQQSQDPYSGIFINQEIDPVHVRLDPEP